MRDFTCSHTARRSGIRCGKPATMILMRNRTLDDLVNAVRDLGSHRYSMPVFACKNPRHYDDDFVDLTDVGRQELSLAYDQRAEAERIRREEHHAANRAAVMIPEDTFVVERRSGYDGAVLFVVVRNGEGPRDRYEVRVTPPEALRFMHPEDGKRPAHISWSGNCSGINGVRRGPGPNEAMAVAGALMRAAAEAARLNREAGLPDDEQFPAYVDRTDVAYNDLMGALA